ncbi:penicillin-binding protein 1C [Enterobacter cloacae]|nr:penicillin-binding protein 1C [Enterobacter cloacae]
MQLSLPGKYQLVAMDEAGKLATLNFELSR